MPSGGLWLRRAGGHLPDPAARGVGGGGEGGGGQGGGGGGSGGGRTSGEKGTAPLDIGAVPGALKKVGGGAVSIRKQGGQWTVKRTAEPVLSSEEELTAGCTDPIILLLNRPVM